MSGLPAGYDAWRTGGDYTHYPVEVYCWNSACPLYGEVQVVEHESEYGMGWYTPEECPKCHGEWHEDEPREEE